jgi:putative oxidoreductase
MKLFETVGSRLRGLHSSWGTVDAAAVLLRGVLGVVFVAHGAQKLFGWFGGAGIDGTAAFFKSIDIPAPHFFAVFVGLTEFGGGLLLVAGLLTVAAGLALTVDMVVAIATYNGANGFFTLDGGWELNLTLIGLLGALTLIGAGARSVDRALGLARADATAHPTGGGRFARSAMELDELVRR